MIYLGHNKEIFLQNKYYASGKKYNSGRNKKSSNKDFNKHIKHNKGHEVFDKKHSNKGKKKTVGISTAILSGKYSNV